jgi:hypothetical protein
VNALLPKVIEVPVDLCSVLISHLFSAYKMDIVSALVDTRNEASWRLLEALGFKRNGTIKNADHFKGNPATSTSMKLSGASGMHRRSCYEHRTPCKRASSGVVRKERKEFHREAMTEHKIKGSTPATRHDLLPK